MAKKKKRTGGSRGYVDESTRMVQEEFDRSVEGIRSVETDADVPQISREWDLAGAVLKRRKSATLAVLPKILERYGSQYEIRLELKRDFSFLCTDAEGEPVDMRNKQSCMDVACALWLLGVLDKTNQLSAACSYFPPDPVPAEDVALPYGNYLPYDDLLVQEMTLLIRQRDSGEGGDRCWITDTAAKRKKPVVYQAVDRPTEEMTPRERFNAVMSLVPPVYLERASGRFEEKIWEFLDLYFSLSSGYCARQAALMQEIRDLFGKFVEDAQISTGPDYLPHKDPTPIPLIVQSRSSSATDLSGVLPTVSCDSDTFLQLRSRATELKEEIDNCTECRLDLAHESFSIHTSHWEVEDSILPPEDTQKLLEFTIDDPYETCMGYLLLLEHGSDLAWTYNAPRGPLYAAIEKLPWALPDEIFWDDDEDEDRENSYQFDPEEADRYLREWFVQDHGEEYRERYRMVYPITNVRSQEQIPGEKINLPQLVYEQTMCIFPRNVWDTLINEDELSAAGVSPQELDLLTALCQAVNHDPFPVMDWAHFLRTERFQTILNQYGPREGLFPDVPEEEQPEGESGPEDDPESLKQALKQERETNRKLRQEVYEARKESQRLEASAQEQEKQFQAERSELVNLRELVYLQANGEDSGEEPEESPVELPFKTRRRVVVFGGHDSWLKAIRPLLPNVTFAAHQYPNADLMRHADEIWLQPNSMAHKQYYKIINTVRTYQIPIRYFTCGSARKCAIEFAGSEPGG